MRFSPSSRGPHFDSPWDAVPDWGSPSASTWPAQDPTLTFAQRGIAPSLGATINIRGSFCNAPPALAGRDVLSRDPSRRPPPDGDHCSPARRPRRFFSRRFSCPSSHARLWTRSRTRRLTRRFLVFYYGRRRLCALRESQERLQVSMRRLSSHRGKGGRHWSIRAERHGRARTALASDRARPIIASSRRCVPARQGVY
jgi:hypothetical protein